jgi:hypothetical protein
VIGIVAFSFGLEEHFEPSICNVRLAKEVERLYKENGEYCIIVAQWEVALELAKLSIPVHCTVESTSEVYLDSEAVMEAAKLVFTKFHVTDVIPVANPFVHLIKCKQLVKKAGFKLIRARVGYIGFNKDSDQAWTRDPFRLILYSIAQVLWGLKGKPST